MTLASSSAPAGAIRPLAPRQALICVAFGLAVWFAAARVIAGLGSLGAFDAATGTVLLYVATAAVAWPTLWLLRAAARLDPAQMVTGLAAATPPALLADGLALVWAPGLYGGGDLAPGGAWLLWGAGWLFIAAFFPLRRPG